MKYSEYVECGIDVTVDCIHVIISFTCLLPFFLIGFALKRFTK